MYERYVADPDSVDAAWHDFFADYRHGESGTAPAQRRLVMRIRPAREVTPETDGAGAKPDRPRRRARSRTTAHPPSR